MIKVYPEGKFSSLLSDGELKEGDELEVTGPYGVFTLRANSDRPLLFIGGGAGMAPILALLRSLAEQGSDSAGGLLLRGPRARRICSTSRSWPSWRERLPNFRFVPALSDCGEDERVGAASEA